MQRLLELEDSNLSELRPVGCVTSVGSLPSHIFSSSFVFCFVPLLRFESLQPAGDLSLSPRSTDQVALHTFHSLCADETGARSSRFNKHADAGSGYESACPFLLSDIAWFVFSSCKVL
jgi:hypothetical protein